MIRRRSSVFLALLPLLAGCGGGGHHSSNPSAVGPQVTIAWPARGRDFAAPTAASAARIYFPSADTTGSLSEQTVERPAGAGAVAKTYTLAFGLKPGIHLMRIEFLVDANSGSPLATATVNVRVAADGTLKTTSGAPLGTVGFDSEVTDIALVAGQTIESGQTADLAVTANTTGGIVALPPGTVSFNVTSGSAFLRTNPDGSFTGLGEGTATVVPTVDGKTGAPTTVQVLAAPIAARVVSVTTSDFVVDPTSARLWASIPSNASNPDSVQGIDFATGSLGAPIRVGGNPTVVAISDDGSTLYAGLQAIGGVRKIDLATNTAGLQYTIPPTGFGGAGYAMDIKVQPGHPSTVALTTHEFGSSGYNGPEIFDDGVKRSAGLGIYEGSQIVWTAADRLVAYDNMSSDDRLRDVAVGAQGATTTRTVPSGLSSRASFVFAGGRLFTPSGVVLDATTLTRVGAFPLNLSVFYETVSGPAVDLTAKRAYFVRFSEDGTARLFAYDTDTYALVASKRIGTTNVVGLGDGRANLVRVGTGLALRLADRVVLIDDVSGL